MVGITTRKYGVKDEVIGTSGVYYIYIPTFCVTM